MLAPSKKGPSGRPLKSAKRNNTKQNSIKHNKKNKLHNSRDSKTNLYIAIPLYLIISLVPLIIYIKKVTFKDPGNLYWDGFSTHYDIFSYYKMVLLLLFTAAGLLIYLSMPKDYPFDRQRKTYYIPLGIYTLLVLLSALASEYKQVAFFGFLERYEGALVLMAYSVIVFIAMNIFKDEKSVKALFGCLLASAAVLSVIGALQYIGIDIFKSEFFMRMITPASLKGGSIKANMPERTVFSTLYNPNYVGSYMAMLLPIITVFIIRAKKLSHKFALAALLALAIINWIGCDSRAGIIGAAAAFAIILLLFRRKILKHWWIALAAAVLLFGGIVAFNFATNGSIVNRIARMATLEGKGNDDESMKALDKALDGLSDVIMDDESLSLVTEKGTFRILLPKGVLAIKDENDKTLPLDVDNNYVSTPDERFKNIRLNTQPEDGRMEVYYNDYHLMDILYTNEGLKSPTNRWLTCRNGRDIESFGFKGMETFGSNRGYIWSRSIPLLKNTILIGYGPDTFALYFPQYDFLGKLRYYQIGGIFVDKAHNMYLQTALNTGVLSLLAMLALFGIYAVSSIKTYWKEDFAGFLPAAGAACFTAFCGYVVAGLANDSVISVAPVFWALLGLGIGINVKLAQEKKEQESNVYPSGGQTMKKVHEKKTATARDEKTMAAKA